MKKINKRTPQNQQENGNNYKRKRGSVHNQAIYRRGYQKTAAYKVISQLLNNQRNRN